MKPTVLFLCGGNSCRSQMAEAFLRKHAGDRYTVYSAGLKASGLHPLTVQVMKEVGIDLEQAGHRAKTVDEVLEATSVDLLIGVCDAAAAACPTLPGVGEHLVWPFEDPPAHPGPDEARLAKFREVRDEIEARIQAWLRERT